jgi:hypothetical protein
MTRTRRKLKEKKFVLLLFAFVMDVERNNSDLDRHHSSSNFYAQKDVDLVRLEPVLDVNLDGVVLFCQGHGATS